MKYILTIILAVCGVWQASYAADYNRSVLKVSMSGGELLAIKIDGRDYGKYGKTMTVGDLPAGRHTIQVYEFLAYRDRAGGRAKLVYQGSVRTKRGMVTDCIVDKSSRDMRLREYAVDNGAEPSAKRSIYSDRQPMEEQDGNNESDSYTLVIEDPERFEEKKEPEDPESLNVWYGANYPSSSSSNQSVQAEEKEPSKEERLQMEHEERVSRNAHKSTGYEAFYQSDFSKLERVVKEYSGDEKRLEIIKGELRHYYFTTKELEEIGSWLDYDNHKLELYKWAYEKNVKDKENYDELADTLYPRYYGDRLKEHMKKVDR